MDEGVRNKINALVGDPRLVELRTSACIAVSKALDSGATYLHVPAAIGGDARIKGLSVVLDIAAELAISTQYLFSEQRWYAGNALVRQIIECEYLLTVFAADPNLAETWLRSSPHELRKWWSPAAMRSRTNGRFADTEYWEHCERGGHPVPSALPFLKGNFMSPFDQRFCWIDLAGHLRRTFIAMLSCFDAYGFGERLQEQPYLTASTVLDEWKAEDPAPDLLQALIADQE